MIYNEYIKQENECEEEEIEEVEQTEETKMIEYKENIFVRIIKKIFGKKIEGK